MNTTLPDTDGFGFWSRQIERLGEQDPLTVLAATPGLLENTVASHPAERFAVRPSPGKWSGAEVMGHLVDIEFVFGYRTRTILADAEPEFGGIDQDRWVASQGWHTVPPLEIARRFDLIRTVNLTCWAAVPPEAMTRTGRHLDAGVDLSLELMLRILAGHDLVHLDQLHVVLATA